MYVYRLIQNNKTIILKSDKAKEKYRGVFEIQRSGDKTSSGEIGLDIRTHASPKVGQDQVSGGVSVLSWTACNVFENLKIKVFSLFHIHVYTENHKISYYRENFGIGDGFFLYSVAKSGVII